MMLEAASYASDRFVLRGGFSGPLGHNQRKSVLIATGEPIT
jgi:hypothetical protein